MRRILASLPLLAMAGALTLSLTACNDEAKSTVATSNPTSAKPASTAPFPAAGHEIVHCGAGPWGLAIVAGTAKGNDFCPTASEVVNAYAAERAKQSNGDIAVTVADIRWVCGERQGNPNPYQECASQNESAEQIRLYS
ncbi:hypothetical protein AB0N05_14605 [Nocardia sp. NPDC051030]|uniref:hypothetical protein n=1 Tax=Nocardia sp. NPDC051030 TaxID=3155162 RepID=UPI003443CF67